MFDQIFLSPQVKPSVQVASQIAKLLRLVISGNWEISGKSENFIESKLGAQSSFENGNFGKTSKKLLKKKSFPVVHYFTLELEFALNILSTNVVLVTQQSKFQNKQKLQILLLLPTLKLKFQDELYWQAYKKLTKLAKALDEQQNNLLNIISGNLEISKQQIAELKKEIKELRQSI